MTNFEYWEKRANKAEWIHDQMVETFSKYHREGKLLTDEQVKQISQEFKSIEKQADELFGKLEKGE